MFHRHPDGFVIISGAAGTYIDTAKNFEIDFGSPLPPLPVGIIDEVYDQETNRHTYSTGETASGGEYPWKFGDDAIAALQALLDTKARRDAAFIEAAKL